MTAPRRAFTLIEVLLAMALFGILGVAVVALLGQGMNIFEASTSDTSMQDRLQAVLPSIRADFAAICPAETTGVPPPPVTDPSRQGTPGEVPAPPEPPAVRLRSGLLKMTDVQADRVASFPFVAFVRTNALETEDPDTRDAGRLGDGAGVPLKTYDPENVERGVRGDLLATGGLLEVAYVAIPDDPAWPGMLTLYRLFRAPVGGPKSLLDPANLDSLAKVRKAGRVVARGVLHFGVTFRNVFATSWQDGAGAGRAEAGQPYVGAVWDSTRALEKGFAFFRDAASLADVSDDVFPAMARIDLVLAEPGRFGFGPGEAALTEGLSTDEKRVHLDRVEALVRPGPDERWLKVGEEWMSTRFADVDTYARRVLVARGQRGSPAREHKPDEPVHVGSQVSIDVTLVYKDRYARRR